LNPVSKIYATPTEFFSAMAISFSIMMAALWAYSVFK